MSKTEEATEQDAAMQQLLGELQGLPSGAVLTKRQVLAYVDRMPPVPAELDTSSAIRELRGPLPEDDPEYQHNFGRR
jgi:hypothetical protein